MSNHCHLLFTRFIPWILESHHIFPSPSFSYYKISLIALNELEKVEEPDMACQMLIFDIQLKEKY